MHTTIVDVTTLASHLQDPSWIAVDCRFDLSDPNAGERAFAEGHIPGAVYAHLDRDLAGPITATTGRHPLPDPGAFARTVGGWGITSATQVIAYDADSGVYASRLWWMLRWLGHKSVAVLNGGLRAWRAAGQPMTQEVATRPRSQFDARPDQSLWVDANFVDRVRADRNWRILDARAPERFRGDVEPIDAAAGHVPGARNHPFQKNLRSDAHFATRDDLRHAYEESQAGVRDEQTIVMCGSGVTACHLLLGLEIAGKHGAKLYPGSWSEWIRDPSRAIAKNEA